MIVFFRLCSKYDSENILKELWPSVPKAAKVQPPKKQNTIILSPLKAGLTGGRTRKAAATTKKKRDLFNQLISDRVTRLGKEGLQSSLQQLRDSVPLSGLGDAIPSRSINNSWQCDVCSRPITGVRYRCASPSCTSAKTGMSCSTNFERNI